MLTEIISWVNTISQGNQMIAGALTLALSGSVGYLITKLPRQIASFVKSQFVTSLTLNNTGYEQSITFMRLSNFLNQYMSEIGSRTLFLASDWVDGKSMIIVTLGYGNHFFFYDNRLMWLSRTKLDSSGSEKQKEEITINTFGRSHSIFHKLVKDNMPEEEKNKISISTYRDCWTTLTRINKIELDSLALNKDIKDYLMGEVTYFKENRDNYQRLGLPYKLSMVLYGTPGTGKTSIIRSLASTFDMNICNLSLSEHSDKSFRHAIVTAPSNSIIVIEDFDSSKSVHKRHESTELGAIMDNYEFLTLSGILNTLDGIVSLDGNIIVLTTNHIEHIDPAVLRAGRIDITLELPKIGSDAIREHFERIYGPMNITFPDLWAKEINEIIFRAKDDKEFAIKLLSEKEADNGIL